MTLPSDEDSYDQTDPNDEHFIDALNPATTQLRLLRIGSHRCGGPSSASSHRAQSQGARSATVTTELAELGKECPLVNLLNVKDRFRDKQTQEKTHLAEMWDILAANPIVKPLLGSAEWLPKKFHAMVQDKKSNCCQYKYC
ncbi:hypothetical protein BC835DRAFT_1307563 [Cytidiella melzeri]|nr:hypothetical protein BC835DRAFT_1307563 [Cytidiella melzeri]